MVSFEQMACFDRLDDCMKCGGFKLRNDGKCETCGYKNKRYSQDERSRGTFS